MQEAIKNYFTWTTKDGRELTLKDIGDNHLLNIQKMLQRQKIGGATRIRGCIFGNEVDAWEEEIWDGDEEETLKIISGENKKRGLREVKEYDNDNNRKKSIDFKND